MVKFIDRVPCLRGCDCGCSLAGLSHMIAQHCQQNIVCCGVESYGSALLLSGFRAEQLVTEQLPPGTEQLG